MSGAILENLKEDIDTINFLIAFFKKDEINFARADLPKVFYEKVSQEKLKKGLEIVKKVFPQSTPKMLDTNYSFYWFYLLQESCSLEEVERKKFLLLVAELYSYVHINSIIRKHVKYNFDYNTWWEAVNKSKSKYLKAGGISFLVNIMKENTVQRLTIGPYRNYCSDPKQSVKSYYMLRHKISQVLKPVLEIYYGLLEIKKRGKAVSDRHSGVEITSAATVRNFIAWFDEIIEDESILSKVRNKTCINILKPYLRELKYLDYGEKEYLIRMAIREVADISYWKNDNIMLKLYSKTNSEVEFEVFVKCLINVILDIYKIYVERIHKNSLKELLILYLLGEL